MKLYPILLMGGQVGEFLKLSDFLPSNFEESGIGLNGVNLKTEAYANAQEAVDASASEGKILLWDRAIRIDDIIRVGSNTHIKAVAGKGAVMGNAVNKPMFMNKNLQFFDNNTIIDENITVDGGIWNGNSFGQTTKGTLEFGPANIFSWYGIRNLTLKNHRMYTPKTYAQHATNIVNGKVLDFVVDVGRAGAINMDGVHFDGWCNHCEIKRGVVNTFDDGIAINCDDLYQFEPGPARPYIGFWPPGTSGPASDIEIEDIFFDDSLFGIRILSGQSRVDNISIKNIRGIAKDYCILIDNYWRGPAATEYPGTGNVGRVTIDNLDVVTNRYYFGDNQDGLISLSSSIEELIMTNITPNTGDVPTLSIYPPSTGLHAYDYGLISLNGEIITV